MPVGVDLEITIFSRSYTTEDAPNTPSCDLNLVVTFPRISVFDKEKYDTDHVSDYFSRKLEEGLSKLGQMDTSWDLDCPHIEVPAMHLSDKSYRQRTYDYVVDLVEKIIVHLEGSGKE